MSQQVFRGARVLTDAGLGPAAVHVRDGRITEITDFDSVPPGAEVVEAGAHLLTPGIVDAHVHINEPGRTYWTRVDLSF